MTDKTTTTAAEAEAKAAAEAEAKAAAEAEAKAAAEAEAKAAAKAKTPRKPKPGKLSIDLDRLAAVALRTSDARTMTQDTLRHLVDDLKKNHKLTLTENAGLHRAEMHGIAATSTQSARTALVNWGNAARRAIREAQATA